LKQSKETELKHSKELDLIYPDKDIEELTLTDPLIELNEIIDS
jgi:hypothetical protein